jgi:hypothetical protein
MLNLLSMVSLLLEVLIHHGCCVAEYSSLEENWKVDGDWDAAHKRSSASTEPVNEESLHDVRRSMLLMKKQSSALLARVFECLYPGPDIPPHPQTRCPRGMEETWAAEIRLNRASRYRGELCFRAHVR